MHVELAESRYDRQERITWWDQDRLAASRVLVVGAGALGNEVVKNLALAGVGSMLVVDFDHVEMSNLARAVFFRAEDEGAGKAEVLARRAMELNPTVKVTGVARDMRSFGTGLGRRADVIVGALDSREARLFVNRMAWRVGRPWVDGAIEGLHGVARVFSPPTSCYECTLTERDFEILSYRQSCKLLGRDDLIEGKVPTTATTSSIIAGLQSQEVIKLLHAHREGVAVLDGAAVLDGTNNDLYTLRYPFDEDCLAHETFTDPRVLEAGEETTFEDIVAASGLTGGIVELGDDHLAAWTCPSCGTTESAHGLVALLSFEQAACPECGDARQPVTTTRVAVPGDGAGATLSSFAVRTDEVLTVRSGTDERYVWARQADPDLPVSW